VPLQCGEPMSEVYLSEAQACRTKQMQAPCAKHRQLR